MPKTAPYGSWKSPITSDLIVARIIGLGELSVEGETIYWSEMRPSEQGRIAVVNRKPDGTIHDLLPQPWNARTRVHEYGGRGWLVHERVLYFTNFADQRLYRLIPGREPQPLTPAVDLRYADMVMDTRRNRIIGVREDHTSGDREAVNTISAMELDGSGAGSSGAETGGRVLVSGSDFYSTPRLSPDGTRLCWLSWNHPNMPWDGTELWVARVAADGMLEGAERIAGGKTESIFQPEWSPEGVLYFISDRTGWWNLYRWQDDQIQALHPMDADFGTPQWAFSARTYAFESAGRIICTYFSGGAQVMALLDTRTLDFHPLDLPYSYFAGVQALPDHALFIGASPVEPTRIVIHDLHHSKNTVVQRSSDVQVDPGYLSIPEEIEFPTENGKTAYAFYYPPRNKDFTSPEGELPPLIVGSHGGPTSATNTVFNLGTQYWTSRGFAVVDVNYGGSTGYGREYRERLKGQWGIVDVDDCVNAALYLARTGRADPNRLAIRGGSAGGYTTLAALTFRKVFQAGTSLYGVSDAEALATDTHKFESRYLDGLIGPYPAARDVYVARSPIHFTDQLNSALILLQGSEDRVVPPDQSRKMFEAARAKGLPVAYIEFPGEQHGFRRAENIKRALDAELYFYAKIFHFPPPEQVEPVEIVNL